MPHNDNINTNDPKLDELLRQSLLDLDENDPEHQQLMDEVAESVFGREWPAPANKEREAQLLGAGKKFNFPKWVWILSSLFLTTGIVALFIFYTQNENEAENKLAEVRNSVPENNADAFKATNISVKEESGDSMVAAQLKNVTDDFSEESEEKNFTSKGNDNKKNKLKPLQVNTVSPVTLANSSILTEIKEKADLPANCVKDSSLSEEKLPVKELRTGLPALTEMEISEQAERKAALINKWKQLKLEDYSHIHVSSNAGMKFSDFYLKRGEVSNRDYDIFLKDLILQGKVSEYEIAKPKYEEWIAKVKDDKLKFFIKDYFTCSQYANYPVVCISAEAAKLYCEWLEAQLISANTNSLLMVQVRLPYDDEWKFAARPAKDGKYGTDNGKIRSRKKGYKANFKNLQLNADALLNNDLLFEDVGEPLVQEEHFGKKARKVNFTTTSMAFMMNEFGLYNMSGNVSELVLYRRPDKNATMRTIGGNWNSEVKFLEINAGDEFKNNIQASPFLGFRPEI
ncbi:MAG: SUMF1/EgtB/PvdO family nonheme iron enzyme, partial [Bacteroidia bacterium]